VKGRGDGLNREVVNVRHRIDNEVLVLDFSGEVLVRHLVADQWAYFPGFTVTVTN
jgi:hypothetical protein